MVVLNLLLSLTDERSVLRGYTIKPKLANIPLKGQVLKSTSALLSQIKLNWRK